METSSLKKKTISGFAWKFAEKMMTQGISFVISIVLARLLLPEDYAPVTIIVVFITIANIFIADGFSAALIQKKDADEKDYYTVLWGGIGVSLLLYAILFAAAPFVAQYYEMPILSPTLRVLSLSLIVAAINSVQNAYLAKSMRFKSFFWINLFGTLISGAAGLALAFTGAGIWALIAQSLSIIVATTVISAFIIRKVPKLYFSMNRMKGLFSFGSKILLTNLLFTLVDQLRTLIIGKKYSADMLSFYSKGRHFPQLLSSSISAPLSSVCFPAMSKIQNEPAAVKEFLRKGSQLTSYLVTPLVLGLAAVSKPAVLLLLTEKWLPCVPYIWLGAVYYIFPPIHSFNLEAVKAIGRGDEVFKYGLIKRGVSVATLLATVWISVEGIACGLIASAVIATFINAYQNKKLFDYTYKEQFVDLVPNILLSAVMCAAVAVIGEYLPTPLILTLIIQTLCGAAIVVLLSVVTRNKTFAYVWNMLKAFRIARRTAPFS